MCSCSSACFCLCYYDVPPPPLPYPDLIFPSSSLPVLSVPCPPSSLNVSSDPPPLPVSTVSSNPLHSFEMQHSPLAPSSPPLTSTANPSFRVLQPLVPRDVVLVPARVRTNARRTDVEGEAADVVLLALDDKFATRKCRRCCLRLWRVRSERMAV